MKEVAAESSSSVHDINPALPIIRNITIIPIVSGY